MKKRDIKKIKCPIFKAQNESIEKITKAINQAENIKEKAVLARNLLRQVQRLLSCEHFNKEKVECKICHSVAELRQRTAN